MIGHLIHIGYPKAGSSYLQRWFAAHPQLRYAPGGVAGFKSAFDAMLYGVKAAHWPRYFVTSSESISIPRDDTGMRAEAIAKGQGLRHVRDCDAPLRARDELARLFPNAHILIVTRGFRSMILSSYSQYVRVGGMHGVEAMANSANDSVWTYDRRVAAYREAFGDRVIVMPYELLAEDSRTFRGEIEARLGLDPFDYPESRPNRALSPTELHWYPRLARIVYRLSGSDRLRGRFARVSFTNRLARPIALLDRMFPGAPVTAASVPDAYVESHRGFADALAREPLFRPYAEAYLASPPGER